MISFPIDLLKKQDIYIEGEEPSSFLEVEDSEMISFNGNVHYKLHASMVSGGVLVKGSADAGYEGLCGRCLEKFSGEFGKSDIYLFYEELYGAELDLTEDVRAALVVEVPLNCLCREDCPGLCHKCGTNLNTNKCSCPDDENEDSPWHNLDKLKL